MSDQVVLQSKPNQAKGSLQGFGALTKMLIDCAGTGRVQGELCV